MIYKYIFTALFTLFIYGCVSTTTLGNDIDLSKTSNIQKGVTTKKDIISMFGEPRKREIKKEGVEKWTYVHIQSDEHIITHEEKIHSKALIILMQNNIVHDFDHQERFENK